jgi:catechol 2,3-dioxygenase-like lactoylglutathione lyase family enzyme
MVTGFHHITLRVTDLERSRSFYSALPGFVLDQDFPGEKLRYRVGEEATRLVLVPPLPGTPEQDRFTERRIGLDHLAVGVRDRQQLEALLGVLRNLGAGTEGIHNNRGSESGMITFRDPDNIQWEFFEQA